jgi:hypothetical protein
VAIGYVKLFSRSHGAVIRLYDDADKVIETHEHKGRFQRTMNLFLNLFPIFLEYHP